MRSPKSPSRASHRPRGRTSRERFRADRRGVSVTVGYVLTLVVAALLLATLVTAASGLMESQSRGVIADELDVVGNQLAANLAEADHLARVAHADGRAAGSSEAGRVAIDIDLPRRVAGSGYIVEIDAETIRLETDSPTVVVEVPYPETAVPVESDARFSGGPVRIVYEGADPADPLGNGRLEVRR